MKVGIVGYGWIGKATHRLFPDAQIYDKYIDEYKKPLENVDIAFIAVPTPCVDKGLLDCSLVEDAIANCGCDFVVIRSATNPGFADAMSFKYSHKRIVVQPEYLGETANHPFLQMDSRQFMVLGGKQSDTRKVIECYQRAYNANVKIRQVTRYEAEIIKFSENRAIFYKIMQCQELYDACEKAGVDYYTVREAVYGDDPRMNLWWTFVYPDKRGANSKCIPKDVYAWCAWAESVGIDPLATRSLLDYNEYLLSKNVSE
jgi:UDP-glucose 6-dehydrogenase